MSPTQGLHVSAFLGVQIVAVWSQRQFVWQPGFDVCHGHETGLDFSFATLVHNNLGGLGPDTGVPELRFTNVTVVDNRSVDCVVTNTSEYIRKDNRAPWFEGVLFAINVKDENSVDLKFQLIDHETGEPFMLDRFFFTMLDFDNNGKKVVEWVAADGFQAYYVTESTQVEVSQGLGNKHVFRAKKHGGLGDNPMHPFGLTRKQANRAVAFLFTYTSEFTVTLGVDWNDYQSAISGRNFLFAGMSSVACSAQSGVKPLSQRDFSATYIVNWPGTYYLTQDIVFEPQPGSEVTPDLFPMPDSDIYPQLGGYFLGFFAAVVIQSPSVTFDCRGHEIAMSANFHKRQRFFSTFELSSKPFASAQGPPQFANGLLSPGEPYSAFNVTIQNCRLGLSSHHAIHGNDNFDVLLQNLSIYDFEVGGIQLNGASNVMIKHVDVGPSLKQTFSAELSHAIFLDHLMQSLLPGHPFLYNASKSLPVVLRGEQLFVDTVLSRFHSALQQYLIDGTGELSRVFGAGTDLPDGSAVYGIVLHKRGVAIHDFGACGAFDTFNSSEHSSDVVLQRVNIHDLHLLPKQWTRTVLDDQQVMGPAGDVFQLTKSLADDGKSYRGDLLMDAQLAVGALKHHAILQNVSADETAYYLGAVHIPQTLLEWATGSEAEGSATDFVEQLKTNGNFECFGDAMSHVNKGVVGLRMAHVYNAKLQNLTIANLVNEGKIDADASFCIDADYGGLDVFGAVFENSQDVVEEGFEVNSATLVSTNGGLVKDVHNVTTERRLGQVSKDNMVEPPKGTMQKHVHADRFVLV
jgi:hypothetical protein